MVVEISLTFSKQSWLTPTDRATHCITLSCHHAVHKAGRCMWSTADGRRVTIDNTWQWLTCRCEIILSSEVGQKLQKVLHLFLEIFKFWICLIKILQPQTALSTRPEAFDPVEARPRTLGIGSKPAHACCDQPAHQIWSLYVHLLLRQRKCRIWGSLGSYWSPKVTSKVTVHMISYLTLTETMSLSCTVFEL